MIDATELNHNQTDIEAAFGDLREVLPNGIKRRHVGDYYPAQVGQKFTRGKIDVTPAQLAPLQDGKSANQVPALWHQRSTRH